jgi:O-antigen/teichoic acid export membrane protein
MVEKVADAGRIHTGSRQEALRLWLRQRRFQAGAPGVKNVLAAFVRAGARSGWGLVLPAALSVTGFGAYSLIQATAVAASQLALLGTPQVILRSAGKPIPLVGLASHALLLATAICLVADTQVGDGQVWRVLATLWSMTLVVYGILTSRMKSRRAFGVVLIAESASAGILLVCALGALGAGYLHVHVDPAAVGAAEILAIVVGAACLLAGSGLRVPAGERDPRRALPLLPQVYRVGLLVALDIVIWQRAEIYFIRLSPDGLAGVAAFALAAQFSNLVLLALTALTESWFPEVASSAKRGSAALAETLRRIHSTFTRVYLLILIAALIAVPVAIQFVFTSYRDYILYILLFVYVRVLCAYSGIFAMVLYATEMEQRLIIPVVTSAALSLIGNAALTTSYGLPAAVAIFTLTQVTLAGATYLAYASQYRKK